MKKLIVVLLTNKLSFNKVLSLKKERKKKFRRYEWVKIYVKGYIPVQVVWSELRVYPVKQEQL